MSNKQTTTTTTTTTNRWFFIDGKPLPKSQALAHLVYRFVRTEDGKRISTADFKTWLTEQGKPGDAPLSKNWTVNTPNGRTVAVKAVKS